MQTGSLEHARNVISDDMPHALGRSGRSLRIWLCLTLVLCDLMAIGLGHFAFQSLAISISNGSDLPLIGAFAYVILAAYGSAYDSNAVRFISKSFNRSLTAIAIAFAATLAVSYTLFSDRTIISDATAHLAVYAVLILTFRFLFDRVMGAKYRPSLFNKVMIVDGLQVQTPEGFRVIDAAARGLTPDFGDPLMRNWAASCIEHADRVVIACPPDRYAAWARFLKGSNINVEILMPELARLEIHSAASHGSMTTVGISGGFLDSRNRFLKRALDLTLAFLFLVLFAPIMLACALIIKWEDGGPVLFGQLRVGRGNRLFYVYKFRSMRSELCKSDGFDMAPPSKRHMTKIGRLIRRTSIDELPQLLNVLKGEMSLVGPRPHAPGSRADNLPFWEIEDRYWHRHAIKPGMTGLAQIRGFRGATIGSADLSNRLQSDLEYIRGWSIWRDIAILFSTAFVLVHKNAY